MSKDILLEWDVDNYQAKWLLEGNDIKTTGGLVSAVFVSLFTDARASADDPLPDGLSDDLRGWWGDITSSRDNDSVGSKLWLLERAKTTQETLNNAQQYATEALQWMIDEGVAVKVSAVAIREEITGRDTLVLTIKIYRQDGDNVVIKFKDEWEATANGI